MHQHTQATCWKPHDTGWWWGASSPILSPSCWPVRKPFKCIISWPVFCLHCDQPPRISFLRENTNPVRQLKLQWRPPAMFGVNLMRFSWWLGRQEWPPTHDMVVAAFAGCVWSPTFALSCNQLADEVTTLNIGPHVCWFTTNEWAATFSFCINNSC